MIHYYSNREISEKLEINLARWKRWSRSFLPPDPLGGMQSGYARQYLFKDMFKVFLGGHLLAHLKLSVPDSRQVLSDLSPWLKKNDFLDWHGFNGAAMEKLERMKDVCVYFCPLPHTGTKNVSGFRYLIRKTINISVQASATGRQTIVTLDETLIHSDAPHGAIFLQNPDVRLINLSALFQLLVEKLNDQAN